MKHNFREYMEILSIQLVTELYLLASQLPSEEKFGLKSDAVQLFQFLQI